jgi:hypothetical protein
MKKQQNLLEKKNHWSGLKQEPVGEMKNGGKMDSSWL